MHNGSAVPLVVLLCATGTMVLLASCSAQPRTELPEERTTTNAGAQPYIPYTDTTGQLAEYVVTAFADSKGALWFGTMGKGVARYADKQLSFLSPAGGKGGNVVSSIAEDKDGNLWFAGHQGTGLCRYGPSDPPSANGTAFTQFWEEESSVTSDREGNIWAGTGNGVFRFDGKNMVPFDVPIDRSAITAYSIVRGRAALALKDSKGNLWFRTDGYGALRYDGRTFTHLSKADGLCSNSVNDIAEDAQGRIWFICMQAYQPAMTGDGGLCRFDGMSFTKFPEVKGLHNNDLYTLFKDRKGNIWIGATGVGMYRFSGEAFTLFNATDRPDLNSGFGLQGMTEARNGLFWCGFSGGLFRFDPSVSPDSARFVNVTRAGPWE